jgi:hypothetical protein
MLHAIWIILTIVSFVTPVILILVAPYIKKVINHYAFWFVLGSLCFVLLVIGRFSSSWIDYAQGDRNEITISRTWLLDICPACAFLITVFIIIDPSRKLAQAVAPITIFGALLTLFGNVVTDQWTMMSPDIGQGWFNWIVFGDWLNPMYFMMHYINIILGTLVLLSTPKIKIKQYLYTNLFALTYYGYVLICIYTMGVHENVSGLQAPDWQIGGEYNGVMQILGLPDRLWYLGAIIALGVSYGIIVLIMCGFSLLQRIRKYRWYGIRSYTWLSRGYYDLYSPLDNI